MKQMDLKLLALADYNLYVWPAFLFVTFCLIMLYSKTKKELNKQEKLYFEKLDNAKLIKIKSNREILNRKKIAPIFTV